MSLPLSFVARVRATTRTPARKPLTYSIDAANRVVLIQLLCLEEPRAVVEALGEVLLDRRFEPTHHIVVDCRSTAPVPTRDRVAALAARLARLELQTFRNPVTLVTRTAEAHLVAEEGCQLLQRALGLERTPGRLCRDWSEAVALSAKVEP